MTLCFYLRFTSAWGDQLHLSITMDGTRKVLPMAYLDANTWWVELTVEGPCAITWHYLLNGLAEKHQRVITLPGESQMTVRDVWMHPSAAENTWLTQPFCMPQQSPLAAAPSGCTFRVLSPLLRGPLRLTGNLPQLGGWDVTQAVTLEYEGNGYYRADVVLPAGSHVAYKYLHGDTYETGEDRTLITAAHTVVHDGFTRFPDCPPKAAGVAVPVFSLRSAQSCGIGEFADLQPLADWAALTGLGMIQLLPVNDTTVNYSWTDSYPYAVISAFALHPVYIHLPAVLRAQRRGDPALPGYAATQQQLNAAALLDYEAVVQYKMQCLRELYLHHQPDEDFRQWIAENAYWISQYADFCCRRDGQEDPVFYHFVQYHLHLQLSAAVTYVRGKGIAIKGDLPIGVSLQSADVAAFPELFHTALQAGAPPDDFAEKGQNWGFPTYNWQAMAAENHTWWKQRLRHIASYFDAFRIDHILGFFRIWQIPRHAKDGILGYFEPALPLTAEELQQWGIPFSRERYCEPYITDIILYQLFGADAVSVKAICLEPAGGGHYRLQPAYATQVQVLEAGLEPVVREGLLQLITNVLLIEPVPGRYHPRFHLHRTSSFEALPADVQQGLAGLAEHFFYYRHNALWEQEALRKLPVLQNATNMLVCGEDLGMVPHSVPGVMRQLGILSLEVAYMPKAPGAQAPYLSVVTPSTHDMPTLREWRPAGGERVMEELLRSPAMWCIPLLQDWLSLDASLPALPPEQERINNPAVMPWYWRYRMPFSLESLLDADGLNSRITRLLRETGR